MIDREAMNKGHGEEDEGQMSDREAMKLALEALESAADNECNFHDYKHAADALRKALEQKPWDTTDMAHRAGGLSMEQDEIVPSDYSGVTGDYSGVTGDYMEQEPVAWRNAAIRLGEDLYSVGPNGYYDMTASQWLDWALSVVNTAPPKREWFGLTDEEEIELDETYGDDFNAYIDARDAKLKEKNT